MIVKAYRCDLCADDWDRPEVVGLHRIPGMDLRGDGFRVAVTVEDADKHICRRCINAIGGIAQRYAPKPEEAHL